MKASFLRKNILEKGIDAEKFVDFLQEKKGEDGADITNWTMDDLKLLVNEFYKINITNPAWSSLERRFYYACL